MKSICSGNSSENFAGRFPALADRGVCVVYGVWCVVSLFLTEDNIIKHNQQCAMVEWKNEHLFILARNGEIGNHIFYFSPNNICRHDIYLLYFHSFLYLHA